VILRRYDPPDSHLQRYQRLQEEARRQEAEARRRRRLAALSGLCLDLAALTLLALLLAWLFW